MSHSGRVVVGVSGTPSSLHALRAAVAEARRSGSQLVAALAWLPAGGEIAYRRAPCPPLLRVWEDEAEWLLRNSFDEAFGGVPTDLPVELVVVRGDAADSLVQLADRPEDLLVIGAGARGTFARMVHGGTARRCLGRARCQVLAVPAPELLRSLPWRQRHRRPRAPRELTVPTSLAAPQHHAPH